MGRRLFYQVGFMLRDGGRSLTIIHGLRQARDMGIGLLVIATNSLMLCEWMKGRRVGTTRANNLLEECCRLMSRGWKVEVQHVYRETNKVANMLQSFRREYCILNKKIQKLF